MQDAEYSAWISALFNHFDYIAYGSAAVYGENSSAQYLRSIERTAKYLLLFVNTLQYPRATIESDLSNKPTIMDLLFEQVSFDPLMREMGAVIVEAAHLTAEAIPLLAKSSANSLRLAALAEEVMRVEGRADSLHDAGLKDLFHRHGRTDAMAYLIGSEIYGQLEKVVDRFEDVANEISGIVIENV